jgi:hypothetical protein
VTEAVRPVRAHTVVMKVDGDSVEDVASHLEHIAFQLRAARMQGISISGGPTVSHIFEHREIEKSHDEYFAELEAYLVALRKPE